MDIEKLIEEKVKAKIDRLSKPRKKAKITVEYEGEDPIVFDASVCEIEYDQDVSIDMLSDGTRKGYILGHKHFLVDATRTYYEKVPLLPYNSAARGGRVPAFGGLGR